MVDFAVRGRVSQVQTMRTHIILLVIPAVIVFTLLLPFAHPTKPQIRGAGMLGRINSRGFVYVGDTMMNFLESQLRGILIPRFQVSSTQTLKNIRIKQFNIPTTSITTSSNDIITAAVRDANCIITGDLEAKQKVFFVSVSVQDTFEMRLSGIKISQRISVGMNRDRKLKVRPARCRAAISRLSYSLGGNSAEGWIANQVGPSNRNVKRAILGMICPSLKSLMQNEFNAFIDQLSTVLPLPLDTSIDFALARRPKFRSNTAQLAINGRSFPTGFPKIRYRIPKSFVSPLSRSETMFQLTLSDYVINTFIASAMHHKIVEFSLTEEEIYDVTKLNLSAAVLYDVIPTLGAHIGKPLLFDVQNITRPRIIFTEGSVNTDISCEVKVRVALEEDLYLDVATFELAIKAGGSIKITDNVISGQVADLNVTMSEPGSLFSIFSSSNVTELLNNQIIPRLNSLTSQGFKIPMLNIPKVKIPMVKSLKFPKIGIRNAEVSMKENSIEMATDLVLEQFQ